MPNPLDALSTECEELITTGRKLLSDIARSAGVMNGAVVANIAAWVSRCGHLIRSMTSEKSVYFEQYSAALKEEDFYHIHSDRYRQLGVILGCVEGLYEDFKKGLLIDVRTLLRAEIFGDFLEMAEHLLTNGYKDAAAVLIGAVLEDSLRKLAEKNGIPTTSADGAPLKMEGLNQELYKADVYDKLYQKQVTFWADLRNKAAHGEFDKYDQAQVQMMLLSVQKFCSDFLH